MRSTWPRLPQHELQLHAASRSLVVVDGCPDFVLKTTPDQAIPLARRVAHENHVTCVVLCYNGVVHGYLKNSLELDAGRRETRESSAQNLPTSAPEIQMKITKIIERCALEIHAVGGDWQSRHIPSIAPSGVEVPWLRQLEQEFATL